MKKFLVILMVVAMASFLFVGCLPGTTTPVTEEEEEEEEVVTPPTTVAPIVTAITDAANVVLIALTSTDTQYMNAADVAAGIIVHGTAPTYSEVKIYVDDVCAGTGNTGNTGIFEVVVAKADLGADALDKVIYATAKEVAIDVSAHSVEYAFVLDTVKPSATTLTATAETAAVAATATGAAIGTSLTILTPATLITVDTAADLVVGVWRIDVLGLTAVAGNVKITSPTGVVTLLNAVTDGSKFYTIPGVEVDMVGGTLTIGESYTVTCAAATALVAGRATVLYSEPVTFATCDLGVFTGIDWDTGVPHAGVVLAETYVAYIGSTTYYTLTSTPALAVSDTVRVVVNATIDLAGNIQTTASTLTCTASAASATSLAP